MGESPTPEQLTIAKQMSEAVAQGDLEQVAQLREQWRAIEVMKRLTRG